MAGSATKRVPATAIDANDSTAQEELGATRFDTAGRQFRYVNSPSALTLGMVVGWLTSATALGVGSARVSPTVARCPVKRAAGVAVGTVTASYFGWVQTNGPVGNLQGFTTRISTKGIAKGQALIWGTNKLASAMIANNEHQVFGFARSASSGSIIVAGHLDCL